MRQHLQWTTLTVLGLLAGLALALPLGMPIFAVFGAMAGTPIVLGLVGLSLGTAQAPVIRRRQSGPWWWVAASTSGMAVGLTAGVVLVEQLGRAYFGGPVNFKMLGTMARALSFGTIGVIGGGSLGLAQWLVLRRYAPGCSRWIRVSAGSLGAGLACGSLLADMLMRTGSPGSIAILLVIGSVTTGAFTARTLAGIRTNS